MIPVPDLPDSSSDSDNESNIQSSTKESSSSQGPSISQIQASLQRMKSRQEAQRQNDLEVRKALNEGREQQKRSRWGGATSYRAASNGAHSIASVGLAQQGGGDLVSIPPQQRINSSTTGFPLPQQQTGGDQQKSYLQPIPTTKNVIFAHEQQKNNPIWKFSSVLRRIVFRKDLIPDYIISKDICIIYVSMRFFAQQRDYVEKRLKALDNMFNTRVLLINVDLHRKGTNKQANLKGKGTSGKLPGNVPHIQDINRGTEHHTDETQKELLTILTKVCLTYNATMILAFSNRQAAQYVDMYSQFAHTSRNVLKTKVENDYLPIMRNVLTSVRSVNKTDSDTLLKNMGTFKSIVLAQKSDLLNCPGLGSKKVNELCDAFQTPFLPQGNSVKKTTTSVGEKKKQVTMSKFLTQQSSGSDGEDD